MLEERIAALQAAKARAALDPADPRQHLLAQLTDAVCLLLHQMDRSEALIDGLGQTLEEFQELLGYDEDTEGLPRDDEGNILGLDEYFDGTERPMYRVICPQCGQQLTVDERSMQEGFTCPECGEKLIQAE